MDCALCFFFSLLSTIQFGVGYSFMAPVCPVVETEQQLNKHANVTNRPTGVQLSMVYFFTTVKVPFHYYYYAIAWANNKNNNRF